MCNAPKSGRPKQWQEEDFHYLEECLEKDQQVYNGQQLAEKLWTERNINIWIWISVNHFREGILAWVVGDRSSKTFEPLWLMIKVWQCYFWVTDGYSVYKMHISPEDQIISKSYMTLGRRRKYQTQALSCSTAQKDSMLFKIRRNVETLYSSISLLP